MRQLTVALSLLCLPACDALWTWTAACNAGDTACAMTSSNSDMSVSVSEDLASGTSEDLAGRDLAGADLGVQPTSPDLAQADGSAPVSDGGTVTIDMTVMKDAGPKIDDMIVVVVVRAEGDKTTRQAAPTRNAASALTAVPPAR